MKRIVLLLVLLSLLLTGCCLKHDWMEATCTDPKSCRKCDEIEGEALGHDWQDADCENPKTCERCGETEGEALGHTVEKWLESSSETMSGICNTCGIEVVEKLDQTVLFPQSIYGRWIVYEMGSSDLTDWKTTWASVTIEFFEDDTFETYLTGEKTTGTYGLSHYNATEQRYELFGRDDMDHSYTFYLYAEDNRLILAGSGAALAFRPME